VARATGPKDALGPIRPLPLPDREIGLVVDPKVALTAYARKQILRHLITETKRIVGKLRREGYMRREPGDKWLHDHNKSQIRDAIWVCDNADEAIIVGVAPAFNALVIGSVANECYVAGVPGAASGITYRYYLLFKATRDGQRLAYIHPEPIFDFDRMYLRTKDNWSFWHAKTLYEQHRDAIWDEQFEALLPTFKGGAASENESTRLGKLYKAVTERPSTLEEDIAFVNAMHDWLDARGKLPEVSG
jgi:hypothetical protein